VQQGRDKHGYASNNQRHPAASQQTSQPASVICHYRSSPSLAHRRVVLVWLALLITSHRVFLDVHPDA
jgi:hypothetical protein